MLRKTLLSIILVAVTLGLGYAGFAFLLATGPQPTQVDTTPPALRVQTLVVSPATITDTVLGFGTVRAMQMTRLSAEVTGEVVELADALEVGSAVNAGQILIRLDNREYREQLVRTEALVAAGEAELAQLTVEAGNLDLLISPAERELAAAEWEFGKVDELYQQGAAPKREYEQARFQLEQTRRVLQGLRNQKELLPNRRQQAEAMLRQRRAEVEIARLNVARCAIAAPYAGRIAAKSVELGQRVRPGGDLLTLLDPDQLEAVVQLPASARAVVQPGAAVELTLPGGPGTRWTGRICRLAPTASEATRTFEAFVEVLRGEGSAELLPGFFVRAEVAGETLTDVLLVPRICIQQDRVFVAGASRAEARAVRIERLIGEQAVVSGLTAGDRLIISNLDALFAGAPIAWQDPAGAPTPADSTTQPQAAPIAERDAAAEARLK